MENGRWNLGFLGAMDGRYIYIIFIYTPNLGFEIAVPRREREQAALEGAPREHRGSTGAQREQEKA